MYQGEEPTHCHHLPDEDDDGEYDDHPQNRYPTCQQPPSTPQQPLQPPKPLFSPPTCRPPCRKRGSTPTSTPPPPPTSNIPRPPQQPLQPPKPILHEPSSPPSKPGGGSPPPYDDHDEGDGRKRPRILAAVITALLLLLGVAALILWLLYRPSRPHFTASSVAVYSLNTTTAATPSFVASSLQLTVLTRNPSKRTSLYYDRLAAVVHYNNHPITPPAALPPLLHRKRSTVMVSSVVGGGAPVAAPPDLVEGLAADEAYGVVGLSWVLVGRVRYKAGWFKSGHSRVYVRCDIIVGFKNAAGVRNPYGQMPLLGNPPCLVDI